jgi:dTDP-4-dehydrorhamnose reductase
MTVVILGASGMLGSMVVDCLSRDRSISLVATVRASAVAEQFQNFYPDGEWQALDVEHSSLPELVEAIGKPEWVINCIGVIKPHIHEDSSAEIERAIRVNALFPHTLARAAEVSGFQVLQIATDCVYAGTRGKYLEHESHDALDVYGKSKSLGEVVSANVHHLRVSIIGPEPRKHVSLLDWFLHQPAGSSLNGFTNHMWNGITTLHFARLCHGIIREQLKLKPLQHVIPHGVLSKAELLQCCAKVFDRADIRILPIEAQTTVDRTLATIDSMGNRRLWEAAGYPEPPSVPQMIAELGQAISNLKPASVPNPRLGCVNQ